MEQSIDWGVWIAIPAVLLAVSLAFALVWTAMDRKINWAAVAGGSAVLLIFWLAYGLVHWLVPDELIRCQFIPMESADPDTSPIPGDCSGLDWITDTLIYIGTFGLALAFQIGAILGVARIVKRFRAPPDGS